MPERTAKCALCNQEHPIRLLRYNKNESGDYEYQCADCRKRKRERAASAAPER